MLVVADKRHRVAPPRFSDGPTAAATVLDKLAPVRAKEQSGSTNYWKGIIHDVNYFTGTYDVKWCGDHDADKPVRRLVPPKDILTGWEGWGVHPLAPPAPRIVNAGGAPGQSPPARVVMASGAGEAEVVAGSRAAKRGRGDGAAGSGAVPVQVGEVVMYEHLGIESMEVLPFPAPGLAVDDMAERMVFTVSYLAAPGQEPETMRVSLKEMVQSQTNIHLNALVDHMKLLSLGNPRPKDFNELFPGVEPFPLDREEGLRRERQLARHAACRRCAQCKAQAKQAVPDCPSTEEEGSSSEDDE